MATAAERPLRKDAERNRRRILDAAAELFGERGLGVTLNDIAHHADVGVGTVYRRYPNKELLIDALFEERLEEFVALAREALDDDDAWHGLVCFLERGLELQARNKGLKQLMLGTPEGCARVCIMRESIGELANTLVERARAAGVLRPDVQPQDMPVIQWMLGAVLDHAGAVEPELWRRYLQLLLRGLRTDAPPPDELPVPALTSEQLDALMPPQLAAARR